MEKSIQSSRFILSCLTAKGVQICYVHTAAGLLYLMVIAVTKRFTFFLMYINTLIGQGLKQYGAAEPHTGIN